MIQTENDARNIVETAVKNGWEPHFAVAWGDIYDTVKALGNMLGIPCEEF